MSRKCKDSSFAILSRMGIIRAMRWVWTGLMAIGIAGCAVNTNKVPDPTPKMAMELGVEHSEIVRGHATYMKYCSGCHERVPPGKLDPEYWRGIVPHMAVNAKITKLEEQELLLYLMAAHGTVHGENLQH